MLLLLSLMLLSISGVVNSELSLDSFSSHRYGSKHIFLLAGQSNMAGRGGVNGNKWNGFIPPQCQSTPWIHRLNAGLRWEVAHEPLHVDIDENKTCGIGPGMSFANAIRASSSKIGVVRLVPCAIGGTKLSEWLRGTQHYNELVNRARVSLRGGGVIQALLWYQGESDTTSRMEADSYKGKMEKFITDLRSDLRLPSLPIIQVGLASGEGPFVDKVREAQRRINLQNVAYVDAKCLPVERDHLHLTTQSQVRLGQMMANAFLKRFKKQLYTKQ
ncbi:putative carbohydrate esterase [Thalictrum thalictroides]|uniref:Putative carbohydrate esterase n=1 Tax=Thalictrum thalictroides TaxID=46969 RepID=A0A7J6UZZ8_THATH|nr:putative carbohydrate esterase [Thalictrum thalictroides]